MAAAVMTRGGLSATMSWRCRFHIVFVFCRLLLEGTRGGTGFYASTVGTQFVVSGGWCVCVLCVCGFVMGREGKHGMVASLVRTASTL